METQINKIQINYGRKIDDKGNIQEISELINIRVDDINEAVILYNQLKSRLSGVNKLDNLKSLSTPEISHEEDKLCPRCDSPLVMRKGKNGSFWGCSGYPSCKHTSPA